MPADDHSVKAALAGLVVAFGGPAVLLSPADRLLGSPERLATKVLEELMLWAFLAIIFAIVILWEKKTLASMWIRPLAWSSFAWGLLLAAATIYVAIPFLTEVLRMAGIAGFEAGMAKILVLPLWLRVIAVITAGVVEDALFIGYGFTRLVFLTGSKWMAGIVTIMLVSFLHFPNWGIGPVLAYFVAVGLAVAFFVWRRDLLANIVAHVIVDGMSLVIVPALTLSSAST
jgi:membrane protease YdiL (CAAX protease family)